MMIKSITTTSKSVENKQDDDDDDVHQLPRSGHFFTLMSAIWKEYQLPVGRASKEFHQFQRKLDLPTVEKRRFDVWSNCFSKWQMKECHKKVLYVL